MTDCHCSSMPDAGMLMDIIRVHTEIVKLGLDLGNVMNYVAAQVQELTQAGGAVVELVENQEMVYRAATGIATSQLGLRINRAGSLSGLCLETKAILRCDDCEQDPRVDQEACRKVGLRSMVVSPLVCHDIVVGVLKILSPTPRFFTEKHACILQLMSDCIAASMFNATRHEIAELYHQATHDALTGLANRALFYDHLRQSLALARRDSRAVGILNLDMDGLKGINDHFGHRAGDAAIREMARRIDRASRDGDLVARLGGDEFGVVLSALPDRGCAERVAARMTQELARPFRFEDTPLCIDASIGLALFPDDALEIDTLVDKADQAMYDVKRTRKTTFGD